MHPSAPLGNDGSGHKGRRVLPTGQACSRQIGEKGSEKPARPRLPQGKQELSNLGILLPIPSEAPSFPRPMPLHPWGHPFCKMLE